MYNENDFDHDVAITRHNARGNPYNVWVKVKSYCPAEASSQHGPGCASVVDDASAWTTMGCEIELTRGELDEVTELWEQARSEY